MDWNNDGKKDLITGEYDGYIRIYLNRGTDASPAFSDLSYLQVAGTVWQADNGYTKPDIVDWNNDGRKDIVCGDGYGYVFVLLNVGTDASPVFNSADYIYDGSDPLYTWDASGRASPVVVDWNRDGKKDLIVGTYDGTLRYYENIGTDANPQFNGYTLLKAGGKTISVGCCARPEVADWDNDGWKDLLVGFDEVIDDTMYGRVLYFHALSGPYLKSFTLQDGNTNGFFERSEQCRLTTVLTNTGAQVTGVVATLSTTSAWCTVTTPTWSLGDCPLYRSFTNTAQPFGFVIASNAPFGATVPLTLTISGNGGTYRQTHTLSVEVAKPAFSVAGVLVNDSSGNGDCACNPGETVQLFIKLRNSGYAAQGVVGQLVPMMSGMSLLNSVASFGSIGQNGQAVATQTPFAFTVPSSMPSNSVYAFSLRVSYQEGSQTTNLPVVVSDYTMTSTSYAWVDMSSGTALTLDDEDYVTLPLAFNFPFYGTLRTNYVTLCSNGYLMFGTPYTSFDVRSIPNTAKPNGMIAPWWEDLDPGSGGTIRYRLFGTAPNRYWVAEWANVPRYYYPTYLRSFQVILYENGSIKSQYGPYNGTLSTRAIGLENLDGTLGKAWTGSVVNGSAVLFAPSAGSPDSDGDSLPDAFEYFWFGSLGYRGSDDTDGDGLSNLDEFRAGTNPTDANSRLRIESLSPSSPSQALLQWRSVPGKPYTIWSSSLDSQGWTKLAPAPVTGTTGTNSLLISVQPGAGPRLLRVSTP